MMFASEDIQRYIPQRPPFLFLDEVTAFEPHTRATGVLHLTGKEPFFAGHFPDDPVMPGVLILEHMAQIANFLVTKSRELTVEQARGGPKLAFGMINRARFLKAVLPPADLVTEVTAVKILSDMGIVDAKSFVGEDAVAEAKIQFGMIR